MIISDRSFEIEYITFSSHDIHKLIVVYFQSQQIFHVFDYLFPLVFIYFTIPVLVAFYQGLRYHGRKFVHYDKFQTVRIVSRLVDLLHIFVQSFALQFVYLFESRRGIFQSVRRSRQSVDFFSELFVRFFEIVHLFVQVVADLVQSDDVDHLALDVCDHGRENEAPDAEDGRRRHGRAENQQGSHERHVHESYAVGEFFPPGVFLDFF
mmetsp:Transcript_40438/g.95010  ORF Transcript_40438/g.95010 Transcript_40438/m.95010 type:complete len:208 (-) Transcript_40438:227-850(-)